jgi:hypothetical protein
MKRRNIVGTTIGGAGAAYMLLARRRQLRWGATDQEADGPLAGDGIIASPDLSATRAITIRTSADRVWPWLAQLGQGRGGFYSYDFFENLLGCDIHSADHVVPEWQDVAVGDDVNLFPDGPLEVAVLEPGRSLVIRGAIPMGKTPPPFDFTWAFALQERSDGTTRLLVRERYSYTQWWGPLLVEPAAAVSFVMSEKMLRGIRDRAERTAEPLEMGLRDSEQQREEPASGVRR